MACLLNRKGTFYLVAYKKGRRIWRSLYTRDRTEAEALHAQAEVSKSARFMTLTSFWNQVKPIIEIDCCPSTIKLYDHAVRRLKQVVGDKRLSAYNVVDFEQYKVQRASALNKRTVNKEIRTLKALFQRAVTYGYVEENVVKRCKLLKIDQMSPTFLTVDDVHILLDVITQKEIRDIVIFALNTALRAGEILALSWDDINVTSRQIYVRNRPEHRVKTGKERLVPLNDVAAEILNGHPHTGDRIFQRGDGKVLTVKYLSDRFRYFRKKADLPEGMRFHSLRHTSLTWMHHAGVPAESLRQIAGHSSIATTQIYTHAMPQHLLDAANTLAVPTLKVCNARHTE